MRVSNGMPDQARCFVGPGLGSNCWKGCQQMALEGKEIVTFSPKSVILFSYFHTNPTCIGLDKQNF